MGKIDFRDMELEQLLFLIAIIGENKQFCRVIINHVPEFTDKAKDFCQKLAIFRQKLPFMIEMRFPEGGTANWLAQAQALFSSLAGPELQWPQWGILIQPQSADNDKSAPKNKFFCLGINSVHIGPDNILTLGLRENDLPFLATISQNADLLAGMPDAPAFSDAKTAKAYIEAFRARSIEYILNGYIVRNPSRYSIDGLQQLIIDLKDIEPAKKTRDKWPVDYDVWEQKQEDLRKVIEVLHDDESREIFLRRLKAQLTGEAAYVADSQYAKFKHPLLREKKTGTDSGNDSICSLIQLNSLTAEKINALLPRINWYHPDLMATLPNDPQWIDLLLMIAAYLQEYNIFLGQHGRETVMYAIPSKPRPSHMPVATRYQNGQPLLSIILKASENAEDMERSLNSILSESLPRYEIILILDNKAKHLFDLVNEFIKISHWRIHPVYIDNSLKIGAAWNTGMNMAAGDYIYFMSSGAVIDTSAMDKAIAEMEKYTADAAVVSEKIVNNQLIADNAALNEYFAGKLGSLGVEDKIFKTDLIHKYLISFVDFSDKIIEAGFNSLFFSFARNVVCVADKLAEENEVANYNCKDACESFFKLIDNYADVCLANDIAFNTPEFQQWAYNVFTKWKEDIARNMPEFIAQDGMQKVLENNLFSHMADMRLFLSSLCENLPNGDAEMEIKDATVIVGGQQYNGCPVCTQTACLISAIIIVEERTGLEVIEQLLERGAPQIECVAINNGAAQKETKRLEFLANIYPNLQLYRMSGKAHPSQCMNTGLKLARGGNVIFLNGNVEIKTDFINVAKDALEENSPDCLIFEDQSGFSELYTGEEYIAACFEKNKALDCSNILFNKDFLARKEISFNRLSPDWQADFTLRALQDAGIIILPLSISEVGGESCDIVVYGQSFARFAEMCAIFQRMIEKTTWGYLALANMFKWLTKNVVKAALSESSKNKKSEARLNDVNISQLLALVMIMAASDKEAEEEA